MKTYQKLELSLKGCSFIKIHIGSSSSITKESYNTTSPQYFSFQIFWVIYVTPISSIHKQVTEAKATQGLQG